MSSMETRERIISPKLRVNGKEMMRIQGVYMYVINRSGQVGAVLGFHPLVIVAFEDVADREPLKAYLRVDRWVYPLARSFSPIYVWGPDNIILPDPFSKLTEPIYIVIRLPFAMSKYQKDTLWNLFDVYAHLRGTFTYPSPEVVKSRDKHFRLTEITPPESLLLDELEKSQSAPETGQLPDLKSYRMRHKLLALDSNEAKLSVCFDRSSKKKVSITVNNISKLTTQHSTDAINMHPALHPIHREFIGPLSPTETAEVQDIQPGGFERPKILPQGRGNTMRIYILGPRDPQHIYISTILEWIPVTQLMLSAVQIAFKEQVRLRKEKEEQGVPPTFEGRRLRLFGGFGSAARLNEFGQCKRVESSANGPYMDSNTIDPSYSLMFHNATSTQDLESAAGIFDYAINQCKLQLLAYAPKTQVDDDDVEQWLGPLIPRDLNVRYQKRTWTFVQLMTVSAAVKSDLVYDHPTNYLERLHEDCEHHYPKLRPRNPMLDPQFPYPREPAPYPDIS